MEQTIINALMSCALFRDINEQELSSILLNCHCKTVTFRRQDCYCLSGDVCRNVDIVVSGEMVARMIGLSGRQVEVIRIRCGDIIAPCFIFASDRRLPVEIEPAETTRLLRLSPTTLDALVDRHSTIRRNFIRLLSDISSYLADKIGFLSLMTAREKIIRFLRSEAAAQRSHRITLNLSRQRIADSFGIQKFSLMRCLAELAREGVIRVEGKIVEIVDWGRIVRG